MYELEGLTRRAFLTATAALATGYILNAQDDLPALKKNRITFEKAKKGTDRDKIRYLDQVLVEEYKLVRDAKRNPDGIAKTFYYWADKEHQRKAGIELADRGRAEGTKPEAYVDYVSRALPQYRFWPIYHGAIGAGATASAKSSSLIIDEKLFALENEDELLSSVEKIYRLMHTHENSVTISGKPLDMKNPHLNANHVDLQQLDATAFQLERMLAGKRNGITAKFSAHATNEHLQHYAECRKDLAFYEENRFVETPQGKTEVTSAAEAAETTKTFLSDIDARFDKLGYRHVKVKDSWTLDKK